jgi:hypothetical protein
MKKVFCLVSIVLASVVLFGSTANATSESKRDNNIEQQIGYYCCDQVIYARQCILVNPIPVGNSCFCQGKGWGVVC